MKLLLAGPARGVLHPSPDTVAPFASRRGRNLFRTIYSYDGRGRFDYTCAEYGEVDATGSSHAIKVTSQPREERGDMKVRTLIPLLLVLSWFLPATSAQGAGQRGDRLWALPHTLYPAHTVIAIVPPTNKTIQQRFGVLHQHTYANLSRQNAHGWLQRAQLMVAADQTLYWSYAISYFPSASAVQAAVSDLRKPLKLFQAGPYSGRAVTVTTNGKYATYHIFGSGTILIEEFCSIAGPDLHTNRPVLLRVCSRQDRKLVALLKKTLAASSPTTPIAASVGPPAETVRTTVDIRGHFSIKGEGVAGVPMLATFSFKTGTGTCSGVTDANGDASCTEDITNATKGYTVHVAIVFTYGGQTYPTSTEFTP